MPVVKDAGSLSLEQIGAKLDDLTRRAREGKLDRSDVSGGSFTISNHGVSGSLLAAPIILHQGQAAILGVGKLEKRVIVREVNGQDAILVRPMAYVTLTIDHRVVDGHQTNAWLTPLRARSSKAGRRPEHGRAEAENERAPVRSSGPDRSRADGAVLHCLAASHAAADVVRRDRRRDGLSRFRGPICKLTGWRTWHCDRTVDHRHPRRSRSV